MMMWIVVLIIMIFLCAAVVSAKAVFKSPKDNMADQVYRDNFHYRNEYQQECEEIESIDSSVGEELEEDFAKAQEINKDEDSESEV